MMLFPNEEQRQQPRTTNDYDPDGFAAFWHDYPRHEARKDAVKAWNQIQPTRETQNQIHDALLWQCERKNWKESKQFIPLAASYLRGERWTDEQLDAPTDIPRHRLTPFEQARRAGLK